MKNTPDPDNLYDQLNRSCAAHARSWAVDLVVTGGVDTQDAVTILRHALDAGLAAAIVALEKLEESRAKANGNGHDVKLAVAP